MFIRKEGKPSSLLTPEEAQERLSNNLRKTGSLDNTWGLMRGLQKPKEDRGTPIVGEVHQDAVSSVTMRQFREERASQEGDTVSKDGVDIFLPNNIPSEDIRKAIDAQAIIKFAEKDNQKALEKRKAKRSKLTPQ
jgi:hypothetical protein